MYEIEANEKAMPAIDATKFQTKQIIKSDSPLNFNTLAGIKITNCNAFRKFIHMP